MSKSTSKQEKPSPLGQEEPLFSKKALKRLILPLLAEQLLSISIGFFDTMMVSSIGEAAVSGTSLVDMINVLIINMFAAIATGGAVIVAQYAGRRDRQSANRSADQLVLLVLVISLLTALGCIALRRPLLRLFFGAIDGDVMQYSMQYFLISALSYPFIAVYNAGAAMFRAIGNSRISMFSSFVMNLLNIAGNALFIYGFHLEVIGAAAASLIARAAACIFVLSMAFLPKNEVHLSLKGITKPEMARIRPILKISLPSGIETGIFQLGRVLVVSIISTFGTVQITANAVANNIDSLGCVCGNAMNLAVITVIGQCLGAGNIRQADFYSKKLLRLTYLMTAAANTLLLTSLPLLLRFYTLSEETTRLAALLILIHNGCAMLLWPASFTVPNILKAGGDARFTMIIAILSMFLFRLGISLFLARQYQMGAIGVWCGMIIDWIFRSAVFLLRWKQGKWKKNRVI